VFFGETAINLDAKGRLAVPITAINLDAKGRLAVPIRYREALEEQCGNRMVLTYSAFESGCLWLQPEQAWERVRQDVMALSSSHAAHRILQRRLVGSATAVEPDNNGRILLSPSLRQGAGLEKRVLTLNTRRAEEDSSLKEQASAEMDRLVF
jgi:MraZ protein